MTPRPAATIATALDVSLTSNSIRGPSVDGEQLADQTLKAVARCDEPIKFQRRERDRFAACRGVGCGQHGEQRGIAQVRDVEVVRIAGDDADVDAAAADPVEDVLVGRLEELDLGARMALVEAGQDRRDQLGREAREVPIRRWPA